MEWIFNFIIEIAQFLDGALYLGDCWELRETVSLGSSCLLALLNTAVLGGGLITHLYRPSLVQIERESSVFTGQSAIPSRHSSFHQSYSAIGYPSIEPLCLTSRTIS